MLIKARRTLAYSCPIRYFLKGPNKQKFFDFMIADLERYVELLTKSSEIKLAEVTELDKKKQLLLGDKFFKLRDEMIKQSFILNKFFETLTEEISNGLPGVQGDDTESNDEVDKYLLVDWTCPACRVKNSSSKKECCGA